MKNKIKIGLLIPSIKSGGAESSVVKLADILKDEYEIHIIIFDDTDAFFSPNVNLINLEVNTKVRELFISRLIKQFIRIRKLTELAKLEKYRIIYSFGEIANAINILSKTKAKKIISIRGYSSVLVQNNNYILKFIRKLIFNKADLIITVSEAIRNHIEINYNIPNNKLITIYNGFNSTLIDILKNDSINNSKFQEYLLEDRFVIITLGTYRIEKNYKLLLTAFSIAYKKNQNIRLVIIGKNHKENKEELLEFAQQLNISEFCLFLNEEINPFKYLNKSDLYVLSSKTEGFPNALIEAMLCGLPVIATNCLSGPEEILISNSNFTRLSWGILLNSNVEDIKNLSMEIAQSIIDFSNSEELCKKYSKLSRQRSLYFNYDNWKDKHIGVFNEFS